ncbi:UDP-glucose dehydrogenase family protein [Prauserella endophytica]|uniref:UDP-glucose 6-dehydrogenase n=1 Tax=Prauserella endophytica TaxID=1592324 RepID=A0ABY2S6P4_9PSEU|nr:UDP-glucose/GDP-mannose dehydrogenase family protein [Prauserella endophytica]TKG71555.1 UDP-glucose/GDP-mannose dehydrogenase family protein [Prauserella endophytica]
MRERLRAGVVGAGYVGLTSAACLAELGHTVTCVDVDAEKVERLREAEIPIHEPGLPELVQGNLAAGRLAFTTEHAALRDADVVLLCLPTPTGQGGTADLSAFDAAVTTLRDTVSPGCVVVIKSTVPVGTTERAATALGHPVVSNPEFLREGHAVHDFLHPDRIVIGARDERARAVATALYAGLDAPVLHTDPASAELAKYASNAFLALKVSYVNELAELCERLGADVTDVTGTMGLDERIGSAFLSPGPGWGGSCLPKDTRALLHAAAEAGVDFTVLADAVTANARQLDRVVAKVRQAVTGAEDGSLSGVRLGLLGLTFKAGTDDLRESPALAIAARLAAEGAQLTGYDPGVRRAADLGEVQLVDEPSLVAKDAAGLVLLTEWPEFRDLDWPQLAQLAEKATVVDCRNLLDPGELAEAGFTYSGLGRC